MLRIAGAFLNSIELVEAQLADAANNPSAVARALSLLAELKLHVEGSLKFSDPEAHEIQRLIEWIARIERECGQVEGRALLSVQHLIDSAQGKPAKKAKSQS